MIVYEPINSGSSIALFILDKKDSGEKFCFVLFELIVCACVCVPKLLHM